MHNHSKEACNAVANELSLEEMPRSLRMIFFLCTQNPSEKNSQLQKEIYFDAFLKRFGEKMFLELLRDAICNTTEINKLKGKYCPAFIREQMAEKEKRDR